MENWKLKIFVESVILKVEETIQIAQHVKKNYVQILPSDALSLSSALIIPFILLASM